jgi:autotransporter strand-loop-strand O-heptosyltransferase
MYSNLKKRTDIIRDNRPVITFNFLNGAYFHISSNTPGDYNVKFIDMDTDTIIYESNIKNNMWSRASRSYFMRWKIIATDTKTGTIIFYHEYNTKDKRIYIPLDSRSLGDTLAWIPYVEEFRKKNQCHVICSTFMNHMFKDEYPEIEFVNPGTNVGNIYAMYNLGIYYDGDEINYSKNPYDTKTLPLQQVSSDILGIDYTEIRPRISHGRVIKPVQKQVSIGMHSTAQSKYWNNKTGWQELVDWLKSEGYTVKMLSREGDGYMGNFYPKGVELLPDLSMEATMDELLKSDFYIGLSSGLSWLSWGIGVPTVMISGFTYDYTEMKDCVRISAPENKCGGCFNRHKFDPGDWNWCPDQKGTPRQFECSKSITSDMVISAIKEMIINKK